MIELWQNKFAKYLDYIFLNPPIYDIFSLITQPFASYATKKDLSSIISQFKACKSKSLEKMSSGKNMIKKFPDRFSCYDTSSS